MKQSNSLLLLAVAALIAAPLLLPIEEAEYSGTDQQAKRLVEVSTPEYKPWVQPLWSPPSAEMESLLFALQAALGAGIVGFYVGNRRGRHTRPDRS